MCLILVAHRPEEPVPLLVLANRDEFYDRPSGPADYWQESAGMVAGRDLVSGGTWFGARNERWATVTNIREGVREHDPHHKSRGWLVRDYLQGDLSPVDYLSRIQGTMTDFAGFNLLLGDGKELWYSANRGSIRRRLEPGLYGLSNHLLDTPWPKVVRGKEVLDRLVSSSSFDYDSGFNLLSDTARAADADLPDTNIPLEWERGLSAIFITMPTYGTRCSTLYMAGPDGHKKFIERRYSDGPQAWQESVFTWKTQGRLLDR
jgi:uncharacterized protein with NRDE domain